MPTSKQSRFVQEYLVDLNGKQAAIRAGYSAKTAEVQASRLLRNAKVQQALQAAMQARSRRTEVTADRVVAEFAKLVVKTKRKTPGRTAEICARPSILWVPYV